MADIQVLKNKRKSVKSKITKLLKTVDTLLEAELKDLDRLELENKLQTLIQWKQEYHTIYMDLLAAMVGSVTEEEMEKEIDTNNNMEAFYDEETFKIKRALSQEAAFTEFETAVDNAVAWLKGATIHTMESFKRGETALKELEQAMDKLRPYNKLPLFQPLFAKGKDMLSRIRTQINKVDQQLPAPVDQLLLHPHLCTHTQHHCCS